MTYAEITAKLGEQRIDAADLTNAINAIDTTPDDLYWDMFDAGSIDGIEYTDVIGWPTEADSKNDDGAEAVVRVLLAAGPTA